MLRPTFAFGFIRFNSINFFDEVSTEECQLTLSEPDYNINIVETLSNSGADYYTSGRLEYVKNNTVLAIIDFGDGTCNNDAIVSIGNKTYNIKLF